MSNAADALAVMAEMIDSAGLTSPAASETCGACKCGRPITDRSRRCIVCMTHELEQYCGEFQARRFMLALLALARSKTGALWCAEHGELPETQDGR